MLPQQHHYSNLTISQKFEKGNLAGSLKRSHPTRASNGSFSSTAHIIK